MIRRSVGSVVPYSVIALFAGVYFASALIDYLLVVFGLVCGLALFRWIILFLAAVAYGMYRAVAFHPFCGDRYQQFLSLSPWSIDNELPGGPLHLVWVDAVMIAVLTLLAYVNGLYHPAWPALSFLLGYLSVLVYVLTAVRQLNLVVIVLFLLSFAIYPFRSMVVAVLVLLGVYGLCWRGTRRWLAGFPWNSRYWKAEQVKILLNQAHRRNVTGWPHRVLNGYDRLLSVPLNRAVVISLVGTWWLQIYCWIMIGDGPFDLGVPYDLVPMIAFNAALGRSIIYIGATGFPPISLLGRIFTLRWIIPRYDKIFFAPICVLLLGILGPYLLGVVAGVKSGWIGLFLLFLVLFLAFALPPSLKGWHLTGSYRAFRPPRWFRPSKQAEGLEPPLSALIYRLLDKQ